MADEMERGLKRKTDSPSDGQKKRKEYVSPTVDRVSLSPARDVVNHDEVTGNVSIHTHIYGDLLLDRKDLFYGVPRTSVLMRNWVGVNIPPAETARFLIIFMID